MLNPQKIDNILSESIYSSRLGNSFLLIGTCLMQIHPKIVKKFSKEWENVFSICLEQFHYNQLHAKLCAILGTGRIKKIGFLTVDGSPHCIQMHYVSKYLKRELKSDIEFKHYVISKEGKIYQVTIEAIDKSKMLAESGRLIS